MPSFAKQLRLAALAETQDNMSDESGRVRRPSFGRKKASSASAEGGSDTATAADSAPSASSAAERDLT